MIPQRSIRMAAFVVLPAALTLGVAGPALADHGHAAGDAHQIDLHQLNDSGGSGTVMLHLDGTELTVEIEATGLVPGQPHAQHIHGSTEGHDFHCPDASADEDGDGIVTTAEGLPAYGDIAIALTTEGDTSPDSGLAVDRMPVADEDGGLSYERTIEVSQDVADHIEDLHVVQHGIDVNDNGEYDMDGAGVSELDPELPQEATAPASCGMVEGASIGGMPHDGVETGAADDGAASRVESPGLLLAGGVALSAAAALGWRRLRTARRDG